jgi:hypothetical protein
MISGTSQLLQIHTRKDDLSTQITAWKKTGEAIGMRLPAWERLLLLDGYATGLPEAGEWATSIAALSANRSLLTEPDPVPLLSQKVTQVLREATTKFQTDVARAFMLGEAQLGKSDVWQRLTADQRKDLTVRFQLTAPATMPLGTEEEVLAAMRASSLSERRNLLDAVPQRFARALEEAARMVEPKAVRMLLPSATLRSQADLEQWLENARQQIGEKLKEGPVII